MFKTLDRYIIKKYLGTFIYVVCALVTVICFIDFAEKNDDFADGNLSYFFVFKEYYLNYIPYLANFLSPLLVFVSTIIVAANMASHSEVIAILSTRISYKRMLFSFFKGGVILAVFVFIMVGWILPNANKKRVAFEIEYVNSKFNYKFRNTHIKLEKGLYAYIDKYNSDQDIGYQFTLERVEGSTLLEKVKSNRIVWDSTKAVWHLDPYFLRTYKDGKESIAWMPAKDTVLNMYPKDFRSMYRKQETLTLPELNDYIEEQRERGAENLGIFVTELYERFTYPFAIILLTLVAVTVSSRKSREGTGFQIFLGFILAFVYLFFVIVGRGFIESEVIHPLISAWIPNIAFGILGYILYLRTPK